MSGWFEGHVKWFDSKKGYGFIIPGEGGPDIFVHHSVIDMEGYRRLHDGEPVRYRASTGAKGPQATIVSRERNL